MRPDSLDLDCWSPEEDAEGVLLCPPPPTERPPPPLLLLPGTGQETPVERCSIRILACCEEEVAMRWVQSRAASVTVSKPDTASPGEENTLTRPNWKEKIGLLEIILSIVWKVLFCVKKSLSSSFPLATCRFALQTRQQEPGRPIYITDGYCRTTMEKGSVKRKERGT